MAAEKIRVYDIARKLNLSNKEVVTALEKLGVTVKSHSSTISPEEAVKLESLLKGKKETTSAVNTNIRPPRLIKREKPPIVEEPEKKEEQEKKEVKAAVITQPTPVAKPEEPRVEPLRSETKQPEVKQPEPQRQDFRKPEFQKPEFRQGSAPQRPPFRPGERPPMSGQGQKPPFRPPFRPGERPPMSGQGQKPPFRPPFRPGQGPRPPFKPQSQTQAPPKPGETAEQAKRVPVRKEVPKKKDSFREREEQRLERLEELKLQAKLAAKKKLREEEVPVEIAKEVIIDKQLTVGELAAKLNLSIAAVIKQLMMSGIMATVNQVIDVETAKEAAKAFEYTIIEPEAEKKAAEKPAKKEQDESKLLHRAPVVTIMGHVDHGKTTLLDSIRKTKHKIVSTEAGGITQSIGAYRAEVNDRKIVFIDTPGHAAFTAMRARGAKVTDIVILVVAADDGIMPQTIEAINHAKAAKVPIIVAVNKIDKEGADPDRVLQQLTEYELVPEKWGGETITVEVSALQGLNIDELLEYIILVADVEELSANPGAPASGVIIESKLDKGKGAVATFLVQSGTLKVGDFIVAGTVGGRIRALIDDSGERVQQAGPSTPVEVLGLSEVPEAGEFFEAVENDRMMKDLVNKRSDITRMTRLEAIAPMQVKREMLLKGLEGETKELNIIIKSGTHGAAEAVNNALQQLESKKIFIKVVHLGVGDISEADVMLASASNAILVGFGVKEDPNALRVAADEGVVIRKYDIIYKMMEDIEQTMLGLLEPEYKEIEIGTAEIRQVFTVGKTTKIAGCYVLDGKIIRNKEAKLLRNGKEIYKGTIGQLKRFKDDAKEVASGYECGISFDKFNDIEIGDIIKVLSKEKIERHTLV
ncbi:MAG: hypothetical protein A2Y25_07215 [Candidatus Melainabacteria bacterium GWF2_37_15]|nr:MAG: hypothetical protein A2Y25_07215 [Candidatus Melainabacteria bacterium GWF2_37_15]